MLHEFAPIQIEVVGYLQFTKPMEKAKGIARWIWLGVGICLLAPFVILATWISGLLLVGIVQYTYTNFEEILIVILPPGIGFLFGYAFGRGAKH